MAKQFDNASARSAVARLVLPCTALARSLGPTNPVPVESLRFVSAGRGSLPRKSPPDT